MHNNTPDSQCECAGCKFGTEKVREWEHECEEQYGWFMHAIIPQVGDILVNCHTHGVLENFGHPDLQIVAGLPMKIAHRVFQRTVENIKTGERYEPGGRYDRVLQDMKVGMVSAREGGRPVLRIILPDRHGCLDQDAMESPWNRQYQNLESDEQEMAIDGPT